MTQRPSLVLIGGGTLLERSKVLAVIDASSNSLPLKKYKTLMSDKGMVVDITKGRQVRTLILTDTNHLFLSNIYAETLKNRIEDDDHD